MSDSNNIFDLKNFTEIKQAHLMPCSIDYNKKTVNAEEYFWPTVRELKEGGDEEQGREKTNRDNSSIERQVEDPENPILTASFRGKPLQGKKVKLPNNYEARVLMTNDKNKNTGEAAVRGFKEFYYWNWDQIPSKDDKNMKALQWIQLSQAIHGASADLS